MPKVMTRCPTTNEVVPTNLSIDEGTFRSIAVAGFSYQCKACGKRHLWDQHNAWVGDNLAAPQGVASNRA